MPGRGFNIGAVLGRWLKLPTSQARPVAEAPRRFHVVTIEAPSDACAAALALTGKRFLATYAPRLPLRDCDRKRCVCSLAQHEGRRTDNPDSRERDAPGPVYTGPERRRSRRDRHRADLDDDEDFHGIGRRTPAGDGDP